MLLPSSKCVNVLVQSNFASAKNFSDFIQKPPVLSWMRHILVLLSSENYKGCLSHSFVFICNPIIVLATDASIIAPAASQLPAPAPSSSPAADGARCTAGHVRGVHRGVHMQTCLAVPKPMKEQQLTFIVDSNVKYLNTHEHIAVAVQGMLGRFTCVAARCSTLQAQVWRIP